MKLVLPLLCAAACALLCVGARAQQFQPKQIGITGPALLGNSASGLGPGDNILLNPTLQFDGSGKLGVDLATPNIWTVLQTYSGGVAVGASNSWVNTYLPGSTGTGQVQAFITSPNGGFAATLSATRSSDNIETPPQNVIADIAIGVADNTSVAYNVFSRYTEGVIPASGLFGLFINEESSIENLASSAIAIDSFSNYSTGPTGAVINLRLDSGVGSASNDISAFLNLTNNGGKAKSGIVFDFQSLDTSGGTADAIAMGPDQSLSWYNAADTIGWKLFANSNTGNGQIILGDVSGNTGAGQFDLFLGTSGDHPLEIGSGHVALIDTLDLEYAAMTSGMCTPAHLMTIQIKGTSETFPVC